MKIPWAELYSEGHVDYLNESLNCFLCLLDVFKHLGSTIPQRISEPFYVSVYWLLFIYVGFFERIEMVFVVNEKITDSVEKGAACVLIKI